MIILGSVSFQNERLIINPFEGQRNIYVSMSRNDLGHIKYTVKHNDQLVETLFLFVLVSGKETPYNEWFNSVRNPYVLMNYSVAATVKDLNTINHVAKQFKCDLPFNSHFAETNESHMLKAFELNVAYHFPDAWEFKVLSTSYIQVSSYYRP